MGAARSARRVFVAVSMALVLAAAMVARIEPISIADSAAATSPPTTATIGGSIWVGSNDGSGPNLTPTATDAVAGATVMIQNQHSGGAVITYGTVTGNTWTATVPAPGDYIAMFSAPTFDLTSREFTVAPGDTQSNDAFLAPMPLPLANLLYYSFYDNYVNGEDDAPDDPALNGVTLTAKDEDGHVLATGVSGSQATINLSDGTVLTNTDGLYYFTGLPAGKVVVTADASTAWQSPQPIDPVTGTELGTSWNSSTEFYLMTSEEGGRAWDPTLFPGDPGTEAGAYMIWHGFVEKLGQFGSADNPTSTTRSLPAPSRALSSTLTDRWFLTTPPNLGPSPARTIRE